MDYRPLTMTEVFNRMYERWTDNDGELCDRCEEEFSDEIMSERGLCPTCESYVRDDR